MGRNRSDARNALVSLMLSAVARGAGRCFRRVVVFLAVDFFDVDFFAEDLFFVVDRDAVFFTLLLCLAGAFLPVALAVDFLAVLEWLDDLAVCASASRPGTIIVPASKAPATTAIEPLNQVRSINSLSTRSLFPSTFTLSCASPHPEHRGVSGTNTGTP